MAHRPVERDPLDVDELAPLLLHAWWSHSPPVGLVLAVEDGSLVSRAARSDRLHPFASDPSRWAPLLRIDDVAARRVAAAVLLPASNDLPIPPPDLFGNGAAIRRLEVTERTLAMFDLPAIVLEPSDAFGILLGLRDSEEISITLADSARFFCDLATAVLSSASRGAFLPCVELSSSTELFARWRPFGEWFDVWVASATNHAPPALGALYDLRRGGGTHRIDSKDSTRIDSLSSVVRSAFEHLLDAHVRACAARSLPAFEPDSLHGALFAALVDDRATLSIRPARVAELRRRLDRWLPDTGVGDWGLCLRIDSPLTVHCWPVTASLRSRRRQSLIVDANAIWKAGRTIEIAGERLEEPAEVLLAELARVRHLSPVIDSLLAQEQPNTVHLDLERLGRLLVDDGARLSRAQVSVLRPSELEAGDLALRLDARLSDPFRASSPRGSFVEVDWRIVLDEIELSESELATLASSLQPIVAMRGRYIELRPGEADGLLESLRSAPRRLSVVDLLRLAAGVPTGVAPPGSTASNAAVLRERLRVGVSSEPPPLAGFVGTLRPHQESARGWLARLESSGLGGVLADDMGLGKTATVLSHISTHALRSAALGPTLIVVPTSLLHTWRTESKRFTPSLRVISHHGSRRFEEGRLAERITHSDIVITTYPLITRDLDEFLRCRFSRIIFDEAHILKNPASRLRQAATRLPAPVRFALSGTPLQNHLGELWSIMDLVNPGILGDPRWFTDRFDDVDRDSLEKLNEIIGPFMLRRVKSDPLIAPELPAKQQLTLECYLTGEQAMLYRAVLDQLREEIAVVDPSERAALGLRAITHLIEICDHPALFLGEDVPVLKRSGKVDRLVDVVDGIVAGGGRVLIFTRFVAMGGLIVRVLEQSLRTPIPFFYGGLSVSARDQMVASFQDSSRGSPVMVVSLHAGGTGLTLTAATHVIHLDRWWNPAMQDQATDRVHRIGQESEVTVITLLCPGTLEDRITAILDAKRDLQASVIGDGHSLLAALDPAALLAAVALSDDVIEEES